MSATVRGYEVETPSGEYVIKAKALSRPRAMPPLSQPHSRVTATQSTFPLFIPYPVGYNDYATPAPGVSTERGPPMATSRWPIQEGLGPLSNANRGTPHGTGPGGMHGSHATAPDSARLERTSEKRERRRCTMKRRLVVVGGVAAGMSAASRAKRV